LVTNNWRIGFPTESMSVVNPTLNPKVTHISANFYYNIKNILTNKYKEREFLKFKNLWGNNMSYKFYVYVYLDPRKPGKYSYWENGFGIDFDFEPFYIGEGQNDRMYDHLKIDEKDGNKTKVGKIKHILNLGLKPIIYKICETNNEKFALSIEKFLVKIIGRICAKSGCLSNIVEGGRGGSLSDHQDILKIRRKISESKLGHCSEASLKHLRKLNKSNENREVTWGNKISEALKGGKRTDESKQNMSIAQENREIVKCPFCGKEGKSRMKKYHFDNCKENPLNKDRDFKAERKYKPIIKGICPYCGKEGSMNVMRQWHFDNCKFKPKI